MRAFVGQALRFSGQTIGFGFNLGRQSADDGDMSDVDSIRWMASEHDLEFVDLDTYGVDPAAGEILPAPLSRRHHVVAIKRKFGTPVIATADPDDISAQDTVRATSGGTSSRWSPRGIRSAITSIDCSGRSGSNGQVVAGDQDAD